jgi:hypothetical protein
LLGGVALLDCRLPGTTRSVDALLFLPKACVVIVGVDLPSPTMTLDAPMSGQWMSDGWPMIHPTGLVNPAAGSLELTKEVAVSLSDHYGLTTAPLLLIAVGPYAKTINQDPADMAAGIRVIYPEPAIFLDTIGIAATESAIFDAEHLAAIATAVGGQTVTADELSREGFIIAEEPKTIAIPGPALAAAAPTTRIAQPPRPQPRQGQWETMTPYSTGSFTPIREPLLEPTMRVAPQQYGPPPVAAPRKSGKKWVPIAAVAVVGTVLVGGIIAALNSGSSVQNTATEETTQPTTPVIPSFTPTAATVDGTLYTPKASVKDATCAIHATGNLATWLVNHPCLQMTRIAYATAWDSTHPAAAQVTIVVFPDNDTARQFLALTETPNTGGLADLPSEGKTWPGAPASFATASTVGRQDGLEVKIAKAVWAKGKSSSDDPNLALLADQALRIPLGS